MIIKCVDFIDERYLPARRFYQKLLKLRQLGITKFPPGIFFCDFSRDGLRQYITYLEVYVERDTTEYNTAVTQVQFIIDNFHNIS
jgi:hypothetical protein